MATIEQQIRAKIHRVIQEEVGKARPKIAQKLEDLRANIEESGAMDIPDSIGEGVLGQHARCKRLDIKTVSELIDVPLNELMLYLLNHVKTDNTQHLVEYHMTQVYFFPHDRYKMDVDSK